MALDVGGRFRSARPPRCASASGHRVGERRDGAGPGEGSKARDVPGRPEDCGLSGSRAAAESAMVAVVSRLGALGNGLAGGRRLFSPDGSQLPALGERSVRGMGAEWYFVPAIVPWAGRGVMG